MLNQSFRNCDSGMTLVEVLVAASIGLALLGMTFSSTMSNRALFRYDMVRTRLNQQLRSAVDLMGTDIREAGERLPASFPAIEIVNGADGAPDELVVRRSLLDEVLPVCRDITEGSVNTEVYFADDASLASGCVYSGQTHSFSVWHDYRMENGESIKAYIFDFNTEQGEFFDYVFENDYGTSLTVQRSSGTWSRDYIAGNSAIYIIEEWRYRLQDEPTIGQLLQVVINGDDDNPKNVIYGLTDFQAQAILEDDTVQDDFNQDDLWTNLQSVRVTLTGREVEKGREVASTISSEYFPRNVLSN